MITTTFFGQYNLGVWISAIVWSSIVLITYKLIKSPSLQQGFKIRFFINNNILDIIINIFLTTVILRTGKSVIDSLYKMVNEKIFSNLGIVLDVNGVDVVMAVSLISTSISYLIHKYKRISFSKQTEVQMHVHNELCKHQ